MTTRRYAEGTTVSVDSSRGEISGILAKHGVIRMGWFTEPEADVLQFEIAGRAYRMNIVRPTVAELRADYIGSGSGRVTLAELVAEIERIKRVYAEPRP